MALFFIWLFLVYEKPSVHPSISAEECKMIESKQGEAAIIYEVYIAYAFILQTRCTQTPFYHHFQFYPGSSAHSQRFSKKFLEIIELRWNFRDLPSKLSDTRTTVSCQCHPFEEAALFIAHSTYLCELFK